MVEAHQNKGKHQRLWMMHAKQKDRNPFECQIILLTMQEIPLRENVEEASGGDGGIRTERVKSIRVLNHLIYCLQAKPP
jgi:hypothetical protein